MDNINLFRHQSKPMNILTIKLKLSGRWVSFCPTFSSGNLASFSLADVGVESVPAGSPNSNARRVTSKVHFSLPIHELSLSF